MERDTFILLERNTMIRLIYQKACDFVEWYDPLHLAYYRSAGYNGPDPDHFHPSLADKYLIKKLAEEYLLEVPKELWIEHNAEVIAKRLVFNDFYFLYGAKDKERLIL